ncbi:response regulator [Parasedimentitalea marina]|uniref:Response regulator n=1 Tax=Parasedimentitalea marina TaxID=2483033 RepID=A0A3T0N6Z4_9RHOB|nr:response regulator [Parasedimentitalea marina]AZV79755.1 response regulator [Parasedimentitalea marina]
MTHLVGSSANITCKRERDAKHSECRIIALTANAHPSNAQACPAAGMNDFITKPFRKSDLLALIRHDITRRKVNRRLQRPQQDLSG